MQELRLGLSAGVVLSSGGLSFSQASLPICTSTTTTTRSTTTSTRSTSTRSTSTASTTTTKSPKNEESTSPGGVSTSIVIAIAAGAGALILVLLIVVLMMRRRRRQNNERTKLNGPKLPPPRKSAAMNEQNPTYETPGSGLYEHLDDVNYETISGGGTTTRKGPARKGGDASVYESKDESYEMPVLTRAPSDYASATGQTPYGQAAALLPGQMIDLPVYDMATESPGDQSLTRRQTRFGRPESSYDLATQEPEGSNSRIARNTVYDASSSKGNGKGKSAAPPDGQEDADGVYDARTALQGVADDDEEA